MTEQNERTDRLCDAPKQFRLKSGQIRNIHFRLVSIFDSSTSPSLQATAQTQRVVQQTRHPCPRYSAPGTALLLKSACPASLHFAFPSSLSNPSHCLQPPLRPPHQLFCPPWHNPSPLLSAHSHHLSSLAPAPSAATTPPCTRVRAAMCRRARSAATSCTVDAVWSSSPVERSNER